MKRKMTLRGKLSGLVLICWVLPILILVTLAGWFITENLNREILRTVSDSVEYALRTVDGKIEGAISASRTASYSGVIRKAYQDYLLDEDLGLLYGRVTSYLTQEYKYDNLFLTTVLYFEDHPERFYYTNYGEGGLSTYSNVLRIQRTQETAQAVSQAVGTRVGFYAAEGGIYMVRNLVNSDFKTYAVLVMELNTGVIFGALDHVPWSNRITLWFEDTAIPLTGEVYDRAGMEHQFPVNSAAYMELDTELLVYGSRPTEAGTVFYAVGVDRMALVNELSGFKNILPWLFLLTIPLLAEVLHFFYRNVSRPISGLISAAKEIENGRFGVHVQGPLYNREFEYLSQRFDSMSDKLKYQFERIYREEIALRDAKIMALQSQINPHFLNNTLEIINWEARLAGNEKVSGMIEALSTMLDAALDRKGRPVVHLSQEMMYVDAYLYIIGQRLGKRLTVTKEIDPAVLDEYVPRLVLQPIIENAVEHGIQPLQKGEIIIRARREDHLLVLEIENDGCMTVEDEQRINRLLSPDYDANAGGEGAINLGICNVNQRLRMLYGESSGLTIKKYSDNCTVAKITIAIAN